MEKIQKNQSITKTKNTENTNKAKKTFAEVAKNKSPVAISHTSIKKLLGNKKIEEQSEEKRKRSQESHMIIHLHDVPESENTDYDVNFVND